MNFLDHYMTQVGTVVHAPTVQDRYGNELRDWDNAQRSEIPGRMKRTSAIEGRGERQSIVTAWQWITTDLDTVIDAGDRLEVDGVAYELDGPPDVIFEIPRKVPHHRELVLRLAEG